MTSEGTAPQTLTAHEHPVREIFFEIPYYQRPYSWTTEQSGELLDDLLDAMGSEDRLTDSRHSKTGGPHKTGNDRADELAVAAKKEATRPPSIPFSP
jgi:uncharacterized protein with ParB-like and HNH nuclease domain